MFIDQPYNASLHVWKETVQTEGGSKKRDHVYLNVAGCYTKPVRGNINLSFGTVVVIMYFLPGNWIT